MERLISAMSRRQKTAFLLLLDAVLTLPALLIALQLRLGEFWPAEWMGRAAPLFIILPPTAALISWHLRIPMVVLRAFENRAILKIGLMATILTLVAILLNASINLAVPRSVPGIFGTLLVVLSVLVRLGLLFVMDHMGTDLRANVVIYGAGMAGQQLLGALRSSSEVRPVAFVDDNATLHRLQVGGLLVFPPSGLPDLVRRRNVRRVLLAMPSLGSQRRAEILADLKGLPCEVLALPSFEELLDGRRLADQLRPVTPAELLSRSSVNLQVPEAVAAYGGKTVLVTGAGGSIGSELCRQILALQPRKLVLFDASEFALYTIEADLLDLRREAGVEIVPVLGSVTDRDRVQKLFTEIRPEIVLHAAAYKHVPMVEQNAGEGVKNNVLGTRIVAAAAAACGVARFILVSSDKAVRPVSVMGATKRVAEIVVQDLQRQHPGTVFSMVRFGNVLGSSGSVIPLFQKQIAQGGPVTLTHPDVTRYFMTIPEAVQLVLLAGTFAKGGEVFVLDMGSPVRIQDLAKRMIELSGLSLRDAGNPDGDIEIRTTGLRPGEKLFEELLISGAVTETPHPKIMRAVEDVPSRMVVARGLKMLEEALADGGDAGLKRALRYLVTDFTPDGETLPDRGVPRAGLPGGPEKTS